MTRNSMVLTSLIAAIPGAFLLFLTVMSFLRYAGGWSVAMQALSAILLLIGLGLFLMPVGIFVFSGPRGEKKEAEAGEASSAEIVSADSGESPSSAVAVTDPNLDVVDAESDAFAQTGELLTSDEAAEEEFEIESDSGFEEPVYEGDEFDEDAEEEPKKGKKK